MRSKKFQVVDQAEISITQKPTEYQFLVDLSKHLVKVFTLCQFLMVYPVPTLIRYFTTIAYLVKSDAA